LTAAVLFFALGASLLVLAIPRGIAAITETQQTATVALLAGERPTPGELAESVSTLETALRWAPTSGRLLARLSLVEFEIARGLPIASPDRTRWIDRAEQHAMAALLLNPADGYTWVRLAVIRTARWAPVRDIIEPLITSLDVAPNRRELWMSRMTLLMFYWNQLKPNELPIMRHQIRSMWSQPPYRFFLYDAALKYGRMGDLKGVLGDDPEALEEIRTFDRQMAGP
jgi:hypothetical protein